MKVWLIVTIAFLVLWIASTIGERVILKKERCSKREKKGRGVYGAGEYSDDGSSGEHFRRF